MCIDGGTFNSFHFIDVCLTIPSFEAKTNPYNYKTCLIGDQTYETIQEQVFLTVKELQENEISVTSITTDNYPAQIIALAPWSNKSFLRKQDFDDISVKRIIHCSCACHSLNLVAKSIESIRAPDFIQQIFRNFLKVTDLLDSFCEAGLEKPPRIVKTRWLLVLNQLIYLRKHDIFFIGYSNINYPSEQTQSFLLDDENYDDALGVNFRQNQRLSQPFQDFLRIAEQKNIDIDLFSIENFRNYMYMARVLWPLFQAILFFEKDCSSMVSIFPIFQQIFDYWDELKKYFIGNINSEKWINTISFLQSELKFRQFHTFDYPLIQLSYCLTPAVRIVYRNILKDSGVSIIYDETISEKHFSEFDFNLYLNDYFGKLLNNFNSDNIINENDIENNIDGSNDNSNLHLNREELEKSAENDVFTKEYKKSEIWYFPPQMMKKQSSILYMKDPWIKPNDKHSIDGRKLRYHHRPMTDIEFQLKPLSPQLIEVTLKEVLSRLQYNNEDIEKGLMAFRHWCKTPINEDGLDIIEFYNKKSIRELWEKIRSNFIDFQDDQNPICRGYVILADLALTVIACSASEVPCERYISKQKVSICQNTRNINEDLLTI